MSAVRTESESSEIVWRWKGETVTVGLERRGSGRSILLLPAMSSISTRAEMHGLQARLSERFATIAVDWPGFGDRPRARFDWRPEHYRDFIRFVSETVVPRPYATVAAGHGAGYALAQAAAVPGSLGRLCLVAPTWRGPLPTMAGKRLPVFGKIARAGDTPVLGSLLYRLNVNRPVVRMMARGHVYADPHWLDAARTTSKMALTRAAGARHASLRFVTGELDPFDSRETFLACARTVTDPVLVLYGEGTPPKSRSEMDALAALPNVEGAVLPAGKLAIHEEFPDAAAGAILRFLSERTS